MAGRSSLLGSGLAEDRVVLGDVSGSLGPSLFVLGHFFLLGVGLGPSMRWVGVVKFFDPTRTNNNLPHLIYYESVLKIIVDKPKIL